MNTKFDGRKWYEARFEALNVGWVEAIDDLPDDLYFEMVNELEAAQEKGNLNLETNEGVENLGNIIDKYL